MLKKVVLLILSLFIFSINTVSAGRMLPLSLIKLPKGFSIEIYADDVPNARSMCLGDKGTLFVGTRTQDVVYAIVDENKDNKADKVYTIAKELLSPNGVAFKDGSLYVMEMNRLIRFDHIEDHLENPPAPVVVSDKFPSESWHGWKFIRFGPDGKLYIPIGAPCNVCEKDDLRFASIARINPDGSEFEIFAKGIRNTVGFDWDPATKELWFTDNGRDELGDDIPPDELNHAPQMDMHFGFPYCHGQNIIDPEFGSKRLCSEFTPAALDLGAHVASLGMRFYTGTKFPQEYKGQIFIAEHGSWNRSKKVGYQISLVKLQNNKPVSYEPFAKGWNILGKVWGRPVDVQVMPDGALLVSDDMAGVIYRIFYAVED